MAKEEFYDIYKCDICGNKFEYEKSYLLSKCGHSSCRSCLIKHCAAGKKEGKIASCVFCGKAIAETDCKVINLKSYS